MGNIFARNTTPDQAVAYTKTWANNQAVEIDTRRVATIARHALSAGTNHGIDDDAVQDRFDLMCGRESRKMCCPVGFALDDNGACAITDISAVECARGFVVDVDTGACRCPDGYNRTSAGECVVAAEPEPEAEADEPCPTGENLVDGVCAAPVDTDDTD